MFCPDCGSKQPEATEEKEQNIRYLRLAHAKIQKSSVSLDNRMVTMEEELPVHMRGIAFSHIKLERAVEEYSGMERALVWAIQKLK